jgi:hypothetical protein
MSQTAPRGRGTLEVGARTRVPSPQERAGCGDWPRSTSRTRRPVYTKKQQRHDLPWEAGEPYLAGDHPLRLPCLLKRGEQRRAAVAHPQA